MLQSWIKTGWSPVDAFGGIRLIPFVSEGEGGGGEGGPICRGTDWRTDERGERRASNAVVKTAAAKMITMMTMRWLAASLRTGGGIIIDEQVAIALFWGCVFILRGNEFELKEYVQPQEISCVILIPLHSHFFHDMRRAIKPRSISPLGGGLNKRSPFQNCFHHHGININCVNCHKFAFQCPSQAKYLEKFASKRSSRIKTSSWGAESNSSSSQMWNTRVG